MSKFLVCSRLLKSKIQEVTLKKVGVLLFGICCCGCHSARLSKKTCRMQMHCTQCRSKDSKVKTRKSFSHCVHHVHFNGEALGVALLLAPHPQRLVLPCSDQRFCVQLRHRLSRIRSCCRRAHAQTPITRRLHPLARFLLCRLVAISLNAEVCRFANAIVFRPSSPPLPGLFIRSSSRIRSLTHVTIQQICMCDM